MNYEGNGKTWDTFLISCCNCLENLHDVKMAKSKQRRHNDIISCYCKLPWRGTPQPPPWRLNPDGMLTLVKLAELRSCPPRHKARWTRVAPGQRQPACREQALKRAPGPSAFCARCLLRPQTISGIQMLGGELVCLMCVVQSCCLRWPTDGD